MLINVWILQRELPERDDYYFDECFQVSDIVREQCNSYYSWHIAVHYVLCAQY